MENEVQRRSSGVEALIWAIGCVWAIRVERFLGKTPPPLNCALLLIGLYLTVRYLLTPLAWYGLPRHPFEYFDDSRRGILKLAIFIVLVALVAVLTPGRPQRRVIAALAFPFLGLLGMLATQLGLRVVNALTQPGGNPTVAVILWGLSFGVILAAFLSLPCVLLYRATATPIAALALVPAIAKASATISPSYLSLHPYMSLFGPLWPFICTIILVAIFSSLCHRWLGRPPGESGKSQSV